MTKPDVFFENKRLEQDKKSHSNHFLKKKKVP